MRAADPVRKLLVQSKRMDPLRQTTALWSFPGKEVKAIEEIAGMREIGLEKVHLEQGPCFDP
jgi:hypothetical protein